MGPTARATQMTAPIDFAILAPVPLEHLESGADIARDTGFVAFGSLKWEPFRKVDELRKGAPVLVLLYPSFDYESPGKMSYEASSTTCPSSWSTATA